MCMTVYPTSLTYIVVRSRNIFYYWCSLSYCTGCLRLADCLQTTITPMVMPSLKPLEVSFLALTLLGTGLSVGAVSNRKLMEIIYRPNVRHERCLLSLSNCPNFPHYSWRPFPFSPKNGSFALPKMLEKRSIRKSSLPMHGIIAVMPTRVSWHLASIGMAMFHSGIPGRRCGGRNTRGGHDLHDGSGNYGRIH